jgi:hypothetical protein
MILIACAALGFALAHVESLTVWSRPPIRWYATVRELVTGEIAVIASVLTVAVVPLRLRSPRPRLRRAMTQPGILAASVVLLVWVISAFGWSVHLRRHGMTWSTPGMFGAFWQSKSAEIAPTVASVWLVLVLQRRWRPATDWVDRYGRVLGLVWILVVIPWPLARWLDLLIVLVFGRGVF